jgi:glycosyltransferase involved in cell wall biosynthesis
MQRFIISTRQTKEACGSADWNLMESAGEFREFRTVIFTALPWYLPGYKAGGGIRSIANLAAALGDEFSFKIVTTDRDLGDTESYPGITPDAWTSVGQAAVMYLLPGWRGHLRMMALLRSIEPETPLYLNSVFDRRYAMLPILMNRLGLLRVRRVMVAPRGEFSEGALGIKSMRKRIYLSIARWIGLYRKVVWHASTELEAEEIRREFPHLVEIQTPGKTPDASPSDCARARSILAISKDIGSAVGCILEEKRLKRAGALRVVSISRIAPIKNLLGALEILRGASGEISFHIYGPLEDKGYWNQCLRAIATMPANICVQYMGRLEHERVVQVISQFDLFLLPTLGENYGHVICEALVAGCPVLISDRTPWRALEVAGVGWDIPVVEIDRYRQVIKLCVEAGEEWYAGLSARANAYGEKLASDPSVIEANRRMFRLAGGMSC